MKIVFLSDTHNKHNKIKKLPNADMIIHSGDFTTMGYEHEIRDFLKWYSKLSQYKYKLIIAGNHERLFEGNGLLARSHVPQNVIYLEDSGVTIEGLNFYGTPVSSLFLKWAFMRTEEKLLQHWQAIPNNTDVLITHTPPYGICDYFEPKNKHLGSESLRDEILNRIKPKISVFGHIHSGRGYEVYNETTFINASNTDIIDGKYSFAYEPVVVEIKNDIITVLSN